VRQIGVTSWTNSRSSVPTFFLTSSRAASRESGNPGGGAGWRDEVGPTGVYPMPGGIPKGKHVENQCPPMLALVVADGPPVTRTTAVPTMRSLSRSPVS
jgi:hypothetical protein